MKSLALRVALAILTALVIAACSDDSPTSPTASSGAGPSALADGNGSQLEGAHHNPGHARGFGGGGNGKVPSDVFSEQSVNPCDLADFTDPNVGGVKHDRDGTLTHETLRLNNLTEGVYDVFVLWEDVNDSSHTNCPPALNAPDAQIAVNPKGKGMLRFDADELPDGVSVDLWVHLTRVGGPEVLRSPREFVE